MVSTERNVTGHHYERYTAIGCVLYSETATPWLLPTTHRLVKLCVL